MAYAAALVVIAVADGVICTARRNSAIRCSGIETAAAVTQIKEDLHIVRAPDQSITCSDPGPA